MKALQLQASGKLVIAEVETPTPAAGQLLIKIGAAALNKRDQFIIQGKYPGIQLPCILGSDGAGVVEAVGKGAESRWKGKRVVVNPNINWGKNLKVQEKGYAILGMPSNGTMAEYLVINQDRVREAPEHLSIEQVAALPMGGLTAYRACFYHGKIKAGENVLISGFGGGVAQFAFQFALAVGATVFVTSGDDKKIRQATKLGAAGGFNYKQKDWHKNLWKTKGGFDVVIDSAGGDQINQFIQIMRPGGRIIFYGATNGLPSSLDLYRMFWNQLTLQGSTMGSDEEFVKMIKLVNDKKLVPVIDSVRPFQEGLEAFKDMETNQKSGKLILKF